MKVTFYAHADPKKVAGVVKALKVKTKLLPPGVPGKDETNGGSCCLFCGKWGCFPDTCAVLSRVMFGAAETEAYSIEGGFPAPGMVEFEDCSLGEQGNPEVA